MDVPATLGVDCGSLACFGLVVWHFIATNRIRRALHCVDARQDGRRFIVRSDELLTAFLELEAQTKKIEAA